MPIYEYECPKCKTVFERFVGTKDPETTYCPKCQTESIRIMSTFKIEMK